MVETKDIIQAIEVLKIQKGDALILKTAMVLSESAIKRLKDSLKDLIKRMGIKDEIPIVILDEGIEIEILRLKKK